MCRSDREFLGLMLKVTRLDEICQGIRCISEEDSLDFQRQNCSRSHFELPKASAIGLVLAVAIAGGCGSKPTSAPHVVSSSSNRSHSAERSDELQKNELQTAVPAKRRNVAPVEITVDQKSTTVAATTATEQLEAIRAALKPLQVLLGSWLRLLTCIWRRCC